MKFFQLIYDEAGDGRRQLLVLMLLPGIVMALLIAVINSSTNYQQTQGLQWQLLGVFAIGCATVLFTMNRALNMTTAIVSSYLSRRRIEITDQVRSLSLSALEEIGVNRIRSAVGRDHQTIEETAPAVIGLTYFVMQLSISALYIGYLSVVAFGVTMAFLAGAVYFYRRSYIEAEALMRKAGISETAFHNSFENILSGFKEVKLNARRSEDLFENYIIPRSERVEELRVDSGRSFNYGQSTSDLFFFALMGTIVFALPVYLPDLSIPAKIVTVVVFASGAITSVVRTLPVVSRANLAVSNLEDLESRLVRVSKDSVHPEISKGDLRKGISARKLGYTYSAPEEDRPFSVGPLDLDIVAGEMTFIVGGNGSGKSTLIKLLTRLYEPTIGEILWDDVPVTRQNAEEYRSLFSVIFSDFHLFDRLYGIENLDQQRLSGLLRDMKLDDKITYQNNRFSTTNLSTGQRKRLAMVVALLEDRQVCVFDEWAADQDPESRRWYYEEFLASLKAGGRTVIVITHDDRYFHMADKLVWMEEGRINRTETKDSFAQA